MAPPSKGQPVPWILAVPAAIVLVTIVTLVAASGHKDMEQRTQEMLRKKR